MIQPTLHKAARSSENVRQDLEKTLINDQHLENLSAPDIDLEKEPESDNLASETDIDTDSDSGEVYVRYEINGNCEHQNTNRQPYEEIISQDDEENMSDGEAEKN